jgi:penicillin-binding protein 1C
VSVCAASGDLPNADCPQTVATWFIPGKSPIRVSQVHRRIAVDTRTGRQACVPYDARYVRSEVFELWPSDVMSLFARAGVPRRPLPSPALNCEADVLTGNAPQITSPLAGAGYHLRRGGLGSDTIPLAATTSADTQAIYWFVDEAYVGASKPGIAIPWKAEHSGNYLVRAVDDRGRAASRELAVTVLTPTTATP